MIAIGYVSALAYGLLCLALAALLFKLGLPKIYTRKLVHILVGFEWVILYIFHGASWHFLAVCLAFLALLVIVAKKKLMPMISSEGDNSPGTVYYALSMSIMALVCIFCNKLLIPFGIAVFCTSLGDGFAGVVGQLVGKFNPKLYKKKSLFGTVANFVFSVLTILVFREIFSLNLHIVLFICIAIFAVELELFTGKGLDNVTLPLGIFAISALALYVPDAADYMLPILVTPPVVAFVSDRNVLTKGGIAAALVLDVIISVSLKSFGFTLLFSFLFLGVVTDKIKKKALAGGGIEKKNGCRDHAQVIANAAVGGLCAFLYITTDSPLFVVAFAASFAEALSDTTASSFGVFAKNTYDPFRFKRVKKGLSGGVSLIGTLASVFASLVMALICIPFGFGLRDVGVVFVAGFSGALFDSLLGSLLQIKFRCTVCGEITEREEHCSVLCSRHSGVIGVNNDVVNLASTAFSAALALLFCFAL